MDSGSWLNHVTVQSRPTILDQQTLKDRVSARTLASSDTMASAIENQAATIIQEAWRKYDSTRWKYSTCDTGNCGECDGCYYYSTWCCPTCGDQCDYKEIFKGFCSDFCYNHAHDVYLSYAEAADKRDAYEEAQKRIQEECENYDPRDDHDHYGEQDEFVPCTRCGADASGQGYPGTYCSRACFVYYD